MQLMAKCTFANDELRGVGPVQTIDAIGPCYPVLHFEMARLVRAIVKEACFNHNTFSDRF